MGGTGLEPADATACKSKHLANQAEMARAESGALARIIRAWPGLTAAQQRRILTMIDK